MLPHPKFWPSLSGGVGRVGTYYRFALGLEVHAKRDNERDNSLAQYLNTLNRFERYADNPAVPAALPVTGMDMTMRGKRPTQRSRQCVQHLISCGIERADVARRSPKTINGPGTSSSSRSPTKPWYHAE